MPKESLWRISFFAGALIILALLESLHPRRKRIQTRKKRWFVNLAMTAISTGFIRFLVPLAPVAAALYAGEKGWGFLNRVNLPFFLEFAIAFIIFDLLIFLQHAMFHAIPLFWRLHMMHHTDLDIDLTTGIRFHPLEILISTGIKIAVVFSLGAPASAVLVFEIVLNACAMFNHSNLHLPFWMDRMIRILIVTPDMHRVHHSVIIHETNSNFGFNFSFWDRLFGTYHARPMRGHTEMTIGLSHIRNPERLGLWNLLIQPFTEDPGAYPMSRNKSRSRKIPKRTGST